MPAIVRTLKLLGVDSAQVGNWRSRPNVPHNVEEGINVVEVKNEVVIHCMNREH